MQLGEGMKFLMNTDTKRIFAISIFLWVGVCFGGVQKDEAPKRDPFFPVGYHVKVAEQEKIAEVKKPLTLNEGWDNAMELVVINGVSSVSGEHIAMINCETKKVGETVTVEYSGLHYTWRVDKIAPPGMVKLKRVSAE